MASLINLRDIEQKETLGFHGRGGTLFILSILFLSIAAVLVAVRVSTRFATTRELGKDDYFILLATVIFILSHLRALPFSLTDLIKGL